MHEKQVLNMLMVMMHDIRGPLISMAATLNLLIRGSFGKTDESATKTVEDLYERVIRLIGTAEDSLGKVSLVDGELDIEREVLDLRQDIIDPVLDEMSADIQKFNITIDNRLGSIPANRIPIKASKIWLKTVFRNLFSNAIKYGGDDCTIAFGFENNGSYYRLNVYNSGQPIPEEYRQKMFTKFGRFADNGRGGMEGLGLGLYLIKEIIGKHGGEIWYEPRQSGSNFVFTLSRD